MSPSRMSVVALLGLLSLTGCAPEPVQKESPAEPSPGVTPPTESPSPSAPSTESPQPTTPPVGNTPPPAPPPPGCTPNACEQLEAHWVKTFPRRVTAVAADPGANIVFSHQTLEGSDALGLLDPSGQQLWDRTPAMPLLEYRGLSVAPSGTVLAWGEYQGPSGPGGAVAYSFDASGNQATQIGGCGDECGLGPYQMDAAGNRLSLGDSTWASRLTYASSQQGGSWTLLHIDEDAPFAPGASQTPFAYSAAAFDSQGKVLATGPVRGSATFQGRSFGAAQQSSLVVLKLSPEGSLLWTRELPNTDAVLRQLGVTGTGRVVGLGSYSGTLKWSGGELRTARPSSSEGLLLALDAEGNIAWARSMPRAPNMQLAVSASGRIAVASEIPYDPATKRTGVYVLEYDAQGSLRRSRTWSPVDESGAISLKGMAWAGETLVLGGSFRGAVDFGTGAQQGPTDPYTAAGFVLQLR